MIFFSSLAYPVRQIVLGQYIGIGSLVAIGVLGSLIALVVPAVFIAMTAVWSIAAYYFVNHPLIASRVRHTGNIILPFVLIGLGIYILTESFLSV